MKQLDEESDMTIRRALILSLGEYGEKECHRRRRTSLLPKLQRDLPHRSRSGPSCGVRMAAADMETGGVAETGE